MYTISICEILIIIFIPQFLLGNKITLNQKHIDELFKNILRFLNDKKDLWEII